MRTRAGGAFEPECLTLFLNNACALACTYCHAAPSPAPEGHLSDAAVLGAAETVAVACALRGVPMTLALHGGGEPLLDRADAARVLALVRSRAAARGVRLRTYVATSGVVPETTARWAAGAFDLVGLSCDGPPDVQDAQRPRRDGQATSAQVEVTAAVLRKAKTHFHARATVTSATVERQRDIVAYAIDVLGATEVRLEPAYDGAQAGLAPADAPAFAEGFARARAWAEARGVPVRSSLLRPHEPHGPYCNPLRGVLNLVPGDIATACFARSREPDVTAGGLCVGRTGANGRFELDRERITALAAACGRVPAECRGCALAHACSRGCPDVCMLEAEGRSLHETFRCRAQRLLAGTVAS